MSQRPPFAALPARLVGAVALLLALLAPVAVAQNTQGDDDPTGNQVTVRVELPFEEAELADLGPNDTVPFSVTIATEEDATIEEAACADMATLADIECEATVEDGVATMTGEIPAEDASPESIVAVELTFSEDTQPGIHTLALCTVLGEEAAGTPAAGAAAVCPGEESEQAIRLMPAEPVATEEAGTPTEVVTEATPEPTEEATPEPTEEATPTATRRVVIAIVPTVEVPVAEEGTPAATPTETPTPEPTETPTPEPTETPTPEPTETPTPEPTETPTPEPTETPTPEPTETPTPEPTETPTPEPTNTPTPTPEPTNTPTPEPTETPTPEPTNTPTPEPTETPTPEPTNTPTPTPEPTNTPTPEPTNTPTPEPTNTPTPTPEPTNTPTPEPTETPTPEPTNTPTPEPTETPTPEPTETPTPEPTETPTPEPTETPTPEPTATPTEEATLPVVGAQGGTIEVTFTLPDEEVTAQQQAGEPVGFTINAELPEGVAPEDVSCEVEGVEGESCEATVVDENTIALSGQLPEDATGEETVRATFNVPDEAPAGIQTLETCTVIGPPGSATPEIDVDAEVCPGAEETIPFRVSPPPSTPVEITVTEEATEVATATETPTEAPTATATATPAPTETPTPTVAPTETPAPAKTPTPIVKDTGLATPVRLLPGTGSGPDAGPDATPYLIAAFGLLFAASAAAAIRLRRT